jgi:hypothetical protein
MSGPMSLQSSDSSVELALSEPKRTQDAPPARTGPATPKSANPHPGGSTRDPRREMAQRMAKERWANWAKKKFEE